MSRELLAFRTFENGSSNDGNKVKYSTIAIQKQVLQKETKIHILKVPEENKGGRKMKASNYHAQRDGFFKHKITKLKVTLFSKMPIS